MSIQIDYHWYIQNTWNINKIAKEYHQIIDFTIIQMKKYFKNRIISIYLRGSVSVWTAKYWFSDIDFVCIINNSVSYEDVCWIKKTTRELSLIDPNISFYDLWIVSLDEVLYSIQYNLLRINLLAQSALLYWQDICCGLQNYKVWKELFLYLYQNLPAYLQELRSYLYNDNKVFYYLWERKKNEFLCRWIMRTILRSALWIVMLHKTIYTPDVKICYKEFISLYPQFKVQMRQVLDWEYDPINNKKKINKFLIEFFKEYIPFYQNNIDTQIIW